mmetsp:Transcript_25565/g.34845  ORF Transcript_25565/g.34845 Transcript_25565/m.34845 type:complete len:201 (-) Transcript_25565:133-735(-)
MGSMVKGSLLMAICTMPRIVFEYIAMHTKDEDQNTLAKAIRSATRCCLWAFEKCLQFVTEYAYVYIAVEGQGFCTSSRRSIELLAKHPALVALEKLTANVLGWIACVTVPLGLCVVLFFMVGGDGVVFEACGLATLVLAYVTTRLSVGVCETCVTALLVSVVRDAEYCNSHHMSRPHMSRKLRRAFGLPDTLSGRTIEIS